MKVKNSKDTIAAIATPLGLGGIAVIRISGIKAIDILHKIFICKADINNLVSWRVYFGKIVDKEKEIDEVLVTVFKKPYSYTKEDMVEISCHGGLYVSKRILDVIINQGIRLAEPGEFTKRAFLNGRIDLSQAEAVADLIQAKTEASLQASLHQLKGHLYQKIQQMQDKLVDLCSLLEIELDFSEEDLEFLNKKRLTSQLDCMLTETNRLINSYNKGKIIKDGVKFVIVGKPNVGKSSLLNALLNEDRAIVTDIPGTTRDPLEEQLEIKGVLFRAVDTAGLIETDDLVEQQGIMKTNLHVDTANLIIHIFDGSETITEEDERIIQKLLDKIKGKKAKVIGVINKIDLVKKININELVYKKMSIPLIETSAKEMIGIDKLEDTLYHNIFTENEIITDNNFSLIITKERHLEALKRVALNIKKAIKTAKRNLSPEFVILDLREAVDSLGEIIGAVTSEDILNNIFDKFCVGK